MNTTLTSDHVELPIDAIRTAQERIRGYVHRTPVLQSTSLNALAGGSLFFKCENFQRGGAFKARGAHNAILALSDGEAKRGVVTHSSGNHGAAVALAALSRGIPAYIVIPENALKPKVDNIVRLGGSVVRCKSTLEDRAATAAMVAAETGAYAIHSYDNPKVIAGQGTVALELLDDVPKIDVVVAPVGGGGLLSGTAVVAKACKQKLTVVGAEPEMADDAYRSLRAGALVPLRTCRQRTIADGLRVPLSPFTFSLIKQFVDEILTVSELAIVESMQLIWSVLKAVVEPSAAVALAAVLANKARFVNKNVGVILTGGNVDLAALPWLHLPKEGAT